MGIKIIYLYFDNTLAYYNASIVDSEVVGLAPGVYDMISNFVDY
jgi:hypothetical protein